MAIWRVKPGPERDGSDRRVQRCRGRREEDVKLQSCDHKTLVKNWLQINIHSAEQSQISFNSRRSDPNMTCC